MQHEKTTLLKLGGSVITNKAKPFTKKQDIITRLAKEIHSSRTRNKLKLIVGHGGGSYAHIPAFKYQTYKGVIDEKSYRGIVLVQDTAARLNRIIVRALINASENAVSIQPSAGALAYDSRIVQWDINVIERMLEYDLLPVVYGDVSLDLKRDCCILSTEEIFRYLTTRLNVNRIIIGCDVNGVFDKDPKQFPSAKKIPLITPETLTEVYQSLGSSIGIDVTGGMQSKVLTLLEIVNETDIECEILDITRPRVLEQTLNGKKGIGTIIRAR